MNNIVENLGKYLVVFLLIILAVVVNQPQQIIIQRQTLGSSFTPVGGTTYYLSGAGITATANTIQVTSFQTPDGRPLTMSMFGQIGYGTLEPGTSKLEDITFSGITQNSNGTALLTGVSRGVDFISPYTASTTLAKAHSGGSVFILSNTAGFYGQQFLLANQMGTSTASMIFSSTTPPYYDSPANQAAGSYISTTSELASVAYVNKVAFNGAPNATPGTKGIVDIATALQAASSSQSGVASSIRVLPAGIATDTPNTQTRASVVLMTDLTGYLRQTWLNLATASWSFAASSLYPLVLNTVSYAFPSVQGSANSVLTNDGSGNLSWGSTWVLLTSTTTSQAMAFATTTFSAATYLKVQMYVAGDSSGNSSYELYFNSDRTASYGTNSSGPTVAGSTNYTAQNNASYIDTSVGTTSPMFLNMELYNASAVKKFGTFTATSQGFGAASPLFVNGGLVWNNTGSQITGIVLMSNFGGYNITGGTIINVYGHN